MWRIEFEKLATYRIGFKEGQKAGIEKEKMATAKVMLDFGFDDARIALITRLPKVVVEYLRGIEEGRREETTRITKALLNMGMEIEEIASVTGQSVQDVEELQAGKSEKAAFE